MSLAALLALIALIVVHKRTGELGPEAAFVALLLIVLLLFYL